MIGASPGFGKRKAGTPSVSAFTDRYGLVLSTASSLAAESYVEAMDLFRSGNAGAKDRLAEAMQADAGFALPHAAQAYIHMFYGRSAEAKAAAERARTLSGGITPREQQHVEVIAAQLSGEVDRAKLLAREHVGEFPRDTLILTLAMFSFAQMKDRLAQSLAFVQQQQHAYGDDWWYLGMLSMLLQENDQLAAARRAAERSLTLYPRNGGAAHGLAHVFYETNDHSAGLDFLDGWMAPYQPGAPNHCHFTWHLALFDLTSGRYQRALERFEAGIRGADTGFSQLPDAASLLWRCRLYGYTPAALPWDAVQSIFSRKPAAPAMAFGAASAALAYAGTGDLAALEALEQALRDLAAKGNALAGSVTLPLVAGISAYARGEYDAAVSHLAPIMDDLVRIGGSNAQREVFEETLLEALLRAGRYDEAEALLRRRLGRRESGRDNFWLGRVYAGRGETALAAEQRRAGAQLWPTADADAPEFAAGSDNAGAHPTAREEAGAAAR
jgi:tetratricopeptide (TPR) repeat protein